MPLHGFPKFWYGWRKQLLILAEAGYLVGASDQRGYNLSDKPLGVAAEATHWLQHEVGRVNALLLAFFGSKASACCS